ncbi:MAG TPA: ABC transporter substrate-binding protein [Acetobacteraceae bacterium]|nr:ABC transporter substrate-binding protein [Acetobacteraceae bacterium]
MRRRVLLQSLAAGAAASGWRRAAWGAEAKELAIMSAGGAWQAAQRAAWYKPFAEKMGITFNEEVTTEGLAKVQAMVQAGNVPIDLVTVETATVLQGGDTGVLQKLDYSRIAPRDGFLEGSALDAGMGLDVYGDVLAYDTTALKEGPTSVLAVFDTAKYPGKRALRKVAQNNLEWALMADGVPIGDVYKVLATPKGVDQALRKLGSIKDSVVWWTAGAQPPQLLASKEVVMSTAWNGRIQNPIDQDHAPFRIAWDNQILEYDMISIPKGAKHEDLAYKYLAYIAQPEVNGRLASHIPYGPVVKAAISHVPKDVLAKLPNAPDHMKAHLVADPEFWGDYGVDLSRRFNAWLAA